MTYAEKLKDPRWQKKRLEVLQRDKFTCMHCYGTTKELHVHHLSYGGKRNPWDVDEMYLTTLCSSCHKNEEEMVKAVKDLIDFYCASGGTIKGLYEVLYKDIYG